MELFSPGHLIVLAIVVAVLFFGWKQLPDMSRSLGRSLRIFKTEIKGMSEDDKAREAAKAEPQAIEPPASEPAPAAEPPQARPRPVPNANGHAGAESSAKAE
jgi:sec-independent protein translocase protein TatA